MNGSNPLISVIIPVYNIEQYITECVESVLSQTYDRLEIILVDDGSYDDSGALCDKYAVADSRVKVIHQKNQGLVAARKAGLKNANGQYIGFVDGDDYIDCQMYEELLRNMIEHDLDFIHSGYYKNDEEKVIGVSDQQLRIINSRSEQLEMCKSLMKLESTVEMSPCIWSKLFKKSLITEEYSMVPDAQSYGEDLISVSRCIMKCDRFGIIPSAYYHYRMRADSITKKVSFNRIEDQYGLHHCLTDLFTEFNMIQLMSGDLEKRFSSLLLRTLAQINNIYIPRYKYPDIESLFGKKIIIYGAGRVGQDYYQQISKYSQCHIAGWVDSKEYKFEYADVSGIEQIKQMRYDIILVAVLNETAALEIKKKLSEENYPQEIVKWVKPISVLE